MSTRIGVNLDGVLVHDDCAQLTPHAECEWVKNSGVFDYIEKNLAHGEETLQGFSSYASAVQAQGLCYEVMGGIYRVGESDARWREGLVLAQDQGAQLFNCQIFSHHADGHCLSAREVADFFCMMLELGHKVNCLPSFEVHVDMWSERFNEVSKVGELLARRGVDLRLTLDLAHLLFKLGNPAELMKSGIEPSLAYELLHPESSGALFKEWLRNGWVVHAHARSVASPGPMNQAMKQANGDAGRGIQYPFIAPNHETDFHQIWRTDAIEIWRQAIMFLAKDGSICPLTNTLPRISSEFLPFADYGGGARYDIFSNNLACAQWLRAVFN